MPSVAMGIPAIQLTPASAKRAGRRSGQGPFVWLARQKRSPQ